MKKSIALILFLVHFISVADSNAGLEKFNNAVNQADTANGTLERATNVLGKFGSLFKKKESSNDNNQSKSEYNSKDDDNKQSVDEIKETVKESVKQQDSESDKE